MKIEIETSKIVDITSKDFEMYVRLQYMGTINMFDLKNVELITNLPREKLIAIQTHYEVLTKKYPKAVERGIKRGEMIGEVIRRSG